MSINLKDTNVIKCLSYNAYSSIAGFGDKFADSVATGVAKKARKYGMDSDKYGRRNDKWTENVLTYSKEKADMREVYAGWSGFKICESPSCPEYRFIFFQEPVGNHSVNLRLICVEKGNDRNFVIGIIFDGVNPDEHKNAFENYEDINVGAFSFEIGHKKIDNVEKLTSDSVIWADIKKDEAIMLFAVPDIFIKNLTTKSSSVSINYHGKETYTVYLGEDEKGREKWYTYDELEEKGLKTIINYEEYNADRKHVEPIYRETKELYSNRGSVIIDVPKEWESLYKEITEGKIAEYVKSSDSFNAKFPLLAKYGIGKKRAIIYLAILAFLLLAFINDAANGHGTSAYIFLFLVFIGVIAWIHRPKK